MFREWIEQILDRWIKPILWWAKDEKWKAGIVILCLILFAKFYNALFDILTFKNLMILYNFVISIIEFYPQESMNAGLFILILLAYFFIWWSKKATKVIKINFKRGLDDWTIEAGSRWFLVPGRREQVSGNILSVTDSHHPGIYTHGTQWVNYRFGFQTKIISSNFTFVVRAKDKDHCIFVQCGIEGDRITVCPHYVIEGIHVRHRNDTHIDILLSPAEWHDVSVLVEGNSIELKIERRKVRIDISPVRLFVNLNQVRGVMEWNDLIEMDSRIRPILGTNQLIGVPIGSLYFGYEKGSIGFREYPGEHAYFRKIKVDLLD